MESPFNYEANGDSVLIDPYNCDLNLVIDADCLLAYPMSDDGFNMMWAGCRSNYGVNSGKTVFEVQLSDNCECVSLPKDDPEPYALRVGWSLINAPLQLGESQFSFAYCSNGKKATNNQFDEYGESFKAGDSIGVYIDFEIDPNSITISFSKNGIDLGNAFHLDKAHFQNSYNSEFQIKAENSSYDLFFPHVLSKNIVFEMNFGQRVSLIGDEPFAPIKPDFNLIQKIPIEQRTCSDAVLKHRRDSEVLLLVGLPGVGKTEFALQYAKNNPEHSYYIIGVSSIFSKLATTKTPSQDLLEKMLKCMNVMLEVAAQTGRNFIVDQANVYASTRRRKMHLFEKFKRRRAIVLIRPDEAYKERLAKAGEQQSDLIDDMKSDISLPVAGELFDSVEYVELNEGEATSLVEAYNKEGKDNRFNSIVSKRKIVKTVTTNGENLLNNVTNLNVAGFVRAGLRPTGYQALSSNRFNPISGNKRTSGYYGNQTRMPVNRYPTLIPGAIVAGNPYLRPQTIMVGAQWPINYGAAMWTQQALSQQAQSASNNNWAPALPISSALPVQSQTQQSFFGLLPNSSESYRYPHTSTNPNQNF